MISFLGTVQPFSPIVMPTHGHKIIYTSRFIIEVFTVMDNRKQCKSLSVWYYLLSYGIVKKIE